MLLSIRKLVLVLCASVLAACGINQASTVKSLPVKSSKAIEYSVRIESSGDSDEPWIWVATPVARSNLVICAGGACGAPAVSVTVLDYVDQKEGRFLYRSARPVALSHRRELIIAAASDSLQASDFSQVSFDVLRRIRVQAANPGNLPILEPGAAGEFDLTLKEVFNQGNSSWCWAYSAFHTMKTYFNHLPAGDDPDLEAYRLAVNSIHSNQDLRELLGQYRGNWDSGSPFQFLNILRKAKNLPDKMGWENLRGSRDSVMSQVESNLRKGIPSAYCYASHCVTIYGFRTDGEKVTSFAIGDSANSRRYSKSFAAVQSDYWAMWSLPGGKPVKNGLSPVIPSSADEAVDPFEQIESQLAN